jgi:hypothetical protein
MGLACAWWSLDRQDRLVDLPSNADGEVERVLSSIRPKWPSSETGSSSKQKLARRLQQARSTDPAMNYILGSAEQRICEHVRVDDRVCKHSGRVNVGLRPALLYIECSADEIDRFDGPEIGAVRQV